MTVIKVWPIDYSDSYLVRGTEDVEAARDAVLRHWLSREHAIGYLDEATARQCRQVLEALTAEVGWWRTNPCICGDEHLFDMASTSGPGRGNFRGIYLS